MKAMRTFRAARLVSARAGLRCSPRLSAAGTAIRWMETAAASGTPPAAMEELTLKDVMVTCGPTFLKVTRPRLGDLGGYLRNQKKDTRMGYFWLRDNCRCSQCVNQDTMQRNFDTFALPRDIAPVSISPGEEHSLVVEWNDGHRSEYQWDFINRHSYGGGAPSPDWTKAISPWDIKTLPRPPRVSFSEVMSSEDGVKKLTAHLRVHGIVQVVDTPYDDASHTRQLLERIGPIRQTHYGGFYDFIPDLAMADTAYTNLALAAHTDTTYFTEPAGLQAFHLLSHQPAPGAAPGEVAQGGKSLFVDGYHAAEVLLGEDPDAFNVLRDTPLRFHASGNKGINISPDIRFPVLEFGPTNNLKRVRWNNDDRGVVPRGLAFKWYPAARKFDEILKRESSQMWIQLEPGKPIIFDNWRVLHGRSAFTGIRRICGGYINRDDWISRFRNTNWARKDILNVVIG